MRLLLDTCMSEAAKAHLVQAGADVLWAGEWDEDPGDEAILARAHSEGRVLATLDKDLGELAVVRRLPHSGIIRVVGARAAEQGPAVLHAVTRFASELAAGAIVTVEPTRVRVRTRPD